MGCYQYLPRTFWTSKPNESQAHSTIAHVFSWVKFVSEKSIHPCVTTRLSINACVFFWNLFYKIYVPSSRATYIYHQQGAHMMIPLFSILDHLSRRYSIPNGPLGTSPALARYGPARRGPTLCGPMTSSGRAVSCIVPNYRPRHGPMAYFSGRAGTTPRMARWATAVPALSCKADWRRQVPRAPAPAEAGAPR
jgi:hypothetical protein